MEAAWTFLLLVMTIDVTVKGAGTDREFASPPSPPARSVPHNLPFIVNGKDALPGSWPWQVMLHSPDLSCGGILLSKNFVLTAAHCQPSFSQVVLGRRNLPSNDGETRNIRNSTIHPGYDVMTLRHDIAVIELEVPINFTANVKPALLPKTTENFVGTDCFATGWGKTDGGTDDVSPILQETPLSVITNLECRLIELVIPFRKIHSSNICAYDSDKGVCQGDSGGPLQCRRCTEEPWVVSGVTSWVVTQGNDTCVLDAPNVFTRTSSYIDWILEQTNHEASVLDLDNDGGCRHASNGRQSSPVMIIVAFMLVVSSLTCALTS